MSLCVAGSLLALSCSKETPLEVSGMPAKSFAISVGKEIAIQVGTVGPGEFINPPTLTGSSLQFLEVTAPAVVLPGGVRQIFHFKGVAAGQTVIVFHNTNPSPPFHPDVVDTVNVR
jgi:hypothetical protein